METVLCVTYLWPQILLFLFGTLHGINNALACQFFHDLKFDGI